MIYLVAGTRPNFMKIAPIRREIDERRLAVRMMHTRQHFDATMSDVFFRDLGLPDDHTLVVDHLQRAVAALRVLS